MAVPALLYGCEPWTMEKSDWNKIQTAEMKYLRTIKRCTKAHSIRNEDVRKDLNMFPVREKIVFYREKGLSLIHI